MTRFRRWSGVLLAGALLAGLPSALAAAAARSATHDTPCGRHCVRIVTIHYRSHAGFRRAAYVVVPTWYRPAQDSPLPLVISPHGRGVGAFENARRWGRLPAFGGFAVVNPEGQGRRLRLYSWGYSGQIEDLARMPRIVARALPWLHVDLDHVYAFGTSMGGQETLLLVGRYPSLLAGAAAFDSVTDMARRYYEFPRIRCERWCPPPSRRSSGRWIQTLARQEIGGTPRTAARAYAARSPLTYAREIAASGVPLQLWWSRDDHVVVDGNAQSGRLLRELRRLGAHAPIAAVTGSWPHSAEMNSHYALRRALEGFGLIAGRTVGDPVAAPTAPPPPPPPRPADGP